MSGGGETARADVDIGDQDLGPQQADPWNGDQQVKLLAQRFKLPVDLPTEGDATSASSIARSIEDTMKGVVLVEVAGQSPG
ncbi:hypothetical protein ABZS96_45405 [Streptomyces avermitilis]|uniref:hypothetical protein n=1 Tax=Streptomyces avermitilis TaxID=33903 RepID=UPI0033BB719F